MRGISRLIFLVLLFLSCATVLSAQSAEGEREASSPGGANLKSVSSAVLPPGFHKDMENPFRRFEIIAFGSFPLLFFYTNRGFEIIEFAYHSFDASYLPWPFSGSSTTSLDNSERYLRIGITAGLACVVAGIDALIRSSQDRKAAAAEAARISRPELLSQPLDDKAAPEAGPATP